MNYGRHSTRGDGWMVGDRGGWEGHTAMSIDCLGCDSYVDWRGIVSLTKAAIIGCAVGGATVFLVIRRRLLQRPGGLPGGDPELRTSNVQHRSSTRRH